MSAGGVWAAVVRQIPRDSNQPSARPAVRRGLVLDYVSITTASSVLYPLRQRNVLETALDAKPVSTASSLGDLGKPLSLLWAFSSVK